MMQANHLSPSVSNDHTSKILLVKEESWLTSNNLTSPTWVNRIIIKEVNGIIK